ncbi:hypothetical protein TNCV_3948701 [Trichonephila clavipes]|nr:hypothetical protein TNCV_3948701 [Trichonephila clavipes]
MMTPELATNTSQNYLTIPTGRLFEPRQIKCASTRLHGGSSGAAGLELGIRRDESHFQLCPDDHRRRVWIRLGQRADPSFIIAPHTCILVEVMVWVLLRNGTLWLPLEAQLQHSGTSMAF